MHPALSQIEHRPWPFPTRRWIMRQVWHDLLFAHWPIPANELRRFVPDSLTIQEFAGSSWIGVVPFHMSGIALRPFPPIPGTAAFPELNVRIYVERDGKPGVWFLSLDAAHRLAVWTARSWFHLPYRYAHIRTQAEADSIVYESCRPGSTHPAQFRGRYQPTAEPRTANHGSLEEFLVERYCLYTQSKHGTLYRGEIQHAAWPIQPAEAELDATGLLDSHGLAVTGPPVLHFARRLEVVIWPLEQIRSSGL